jgi:hypothetical protein
MDPARVQKDCELIADAVRRNPEKVKRILKACGAENSSRAEIDEAYGLMEELNVTEKAALNAGGGMLWLLVLCLAFMSCEHCHASHDTHP